MKLEAAQHTLPVKQPGATGAASLENGGGGSRPLVLLRYTMIVATAYLLIAAPGFALPPAGVLVLIALALASNIIVARLPSRTINLNAVAAALILGDTLWITAALLLSHGFRADFFYLYFFVLLIAAIGNSLGLIALTALAAGAGYLFVLGRAGAVVDPWQSSSLIRLPFLFATAAFYGYLVRRGRLERARGREDALADLESAVAQRTADLATMNQELTAFTYSVSHDLRAPLRAIDAFSELLIEDHAGALDAEGRDYLERVRRNAQRMNRLIDDLLKLSRLTRAEMRFEPVDLSEMAASIASDLRSTAPNREVSFAIQPGVTAHGDAPLLRVLLDNLIGNAWKYTGRHPTADIAFGAMTGNGQTVYYVRDDGAGFDTAHAEHLFRPFRRLHAAEEFEGVGIGLATAQRVVHRHGGRIWADAAPESGATFFFTLSGAPPAPPF